MSASETGEEKVLRSIRAAVCADVARALRELLETKQLYQSVKVELKAAASEAERLQATANARMSRAAVLEFLGERVWSNQLTPFLQKYALGISAESWTVVPELRSRTESKFGAEDLVVTAPPTEIYCRKCKGRKAHNSGSLSIQTVSPAYPLGKPNEQVFTCGYECQVCRTTPVVFQITRRVEKLILTGCSEYPKVSVSPVIPEDIEDYVSEAIVAHATGRLLAALFFLRTAVEQYMRKVTGLSGRQTGDELAAACYQHLNDTLPRHEWVLGNIYSELSEKLHSAEPSEKQFNKSLAELERFFRLIELYPLKSSTLSRTTPH